MKAKFVLVFVIGLLFTDIRLIFAQPIAVSVTVTNTTNAVINLSAWGQDRKNTWPPCSPNKLGQLQAGETKFYSLMCEVNQTYGTFTISMVGQSEFWNWPAYLPSPGCHEECWSSAGGNVDHLYIYLKDNYQMWNRPIP